jgi:hypothetical protein
VARRSHSRKQLFFAALALAGSPEEEGEPMSLTEFGAENRYNAQYIMRVLNDRDRSVAVDALVNGFIRKHLPPELVPASLAAA